MSSGLTWCSEEVKCLIGFGPEEHVSQKLDTRTQKQWSLCHERRQMKESSCERSVEQCCAKTARHNGKRACCPYWQAILRRVLPGRTHQGYLFCCCCWLGCDTTSNELFQGSHGIRPGPTLLGSVVSLNVRVHLCSQMSKRTETKGKGPLVTEQHLESIQVWKQPSSNRRPWLRAAGIILANTLGYSITSQDVKWHHTICSFPWAPLNQKSCSESPVTCLSFIFFH